MDNVIIILILLAIVGGIILYLLKAKKSGAKCIGCPYAKQCGDKCGGHCSHAKNGSETEK